MDWVGYCSICASYIISKSTRKRCTSYILVYVMKKQLYVVAATKIKCCLKRDERHVQSRLSEKEIDIQ